MPTNDAESEDVSDLDVEPRTERALREGILVTRAPADDRYFVYGESGKKYIVNAATGECSCPDYQRREPEGGCKHVRRTRLETGRTAVPDGVTPESPGVDRFLAAAVAVRENVAIRADGGEVLGHEADNAHDQDADAETDDRPDDCDCWDADLSLPCWECYKNGFRSQNPAEPGADHDDAAANSNQQ